MDYAPYNDPLDIPRTVVRGQMHAYHPQAEVPLVFRHYKYKSYERGKFGGIGPRGRCSLFFYVGGSFNFITENSICNMKYGDVFISNSREVFWSTSHVDTVMEYYQIDLPDSFFDMVYCSEFFYNVFYGRNDHENNLLRMDDEQKQRVFTKLARMDSLISNNTPANEVTAYSYFVQIVSIINENIHKSANVSLAANTHQVVIKALEYIHANYATISSTDEVTAYCHSSTVHLRRLFKKVMGCTPGDYIRDLRIDHAKFMLQEGKDVTTAAFESGFMSSSYFISVFKKQVGTTPLKYKNKYSEEDN